MRRIHFWEKKFFLIHDLHTKGTYRHTGSNVSKNFDQNSYFQQIRIITGKMSVCTHISQLFWLFCESIGIYLTYFGTFIRFYNPRLRVIKCKFDLNFKEIWEKSSFFKKKWKKTENVKYWKSCVFYVCWLMYYIFSVLLHISKH